MKLSARNQFQGTVTRITEGDGEGWYTRVCRRHYRRLGEEHGFEGKGPCDSRHQGY